MYKKKRRSQTEQEDGLSFYSICFSSQHVYLQRVSIIKGKKKTSLGPFFHKSQSLWTGNASILLKETPNNAFQSEVSLSFLSFRAHTPVLVYLYHVKQHPCPPMSWILSLMWSSSCLRHWATSAMQGPVMRKQGFLPGPGPVALSWKDFLPERKSRFSIELRNARNVHKCPTSFFFFFLFFVLDASLLSYFGVFFLHRGWSTHWLHTVSSFWLNGF